jgi:hypothetical protein
VGKTCSGSWPAAEKRSKKFFVNSFLNHFDFIFEAVEGLSGSLKRFGRFALGFEGSQNN